MAIKSDNWIKKMSSEHDMISPFTDEQIKTGTISYGVSSYGYDIRVADEYKIFTKEFDEVERQHPYSIWSKWSLLMSAYSRYQRNDYELAIASALRYIELYPASEKTYFAS